MKPRGKRIALATAALAVATLVWGGIALRGPILQWLRPPIRLEFRLAETAPGPGLIEATQSGRKVYLHPEAPVTNRDVASATVAFDEMGKPAISFKLNAAGAEKMWLMTGENVGKLLAIRFDGQVVGTATIRTQFGNRGQITGNFTRAEAERIASAIAAH